MLQQKLQQEQVESLCSDFITMESKVKSTNRLSDSPSVINKFSSKYLCDLNRFVVVCTRGASKWKTIVNILLFLGLDF